MSHSWLSRAGCSAALVVVGASVLTALESAVAPPATAAVTHRVLITGDSITHGSNGDYTWRYRLDKKLSQTAPGQYAIVGPNAGLFDHVDNTTSTNYLDPNFTGKQHAARWGTTFIDQLPNVGQQVSNSNANTLVVMLGSNDLSFYTSPAATVANLKKYIQAARAAKPGIDVVVGEVVTRWNAWTKTLTLVDQANEYKAGVASLASQLNTSSERVVVAPTLSGWDPVNHTWDGTHPNAAGETLIAQRVSEGLAKLGLGTAQPNVYNAGARWSMKAPAPTVTVGTEKATLSWSLKSTGSTGMFMSYHLDKPGQEWAHLPYPVGPSDNNQWTISPLAGGANYDFVLVASKGFMNSDVFGPQVKKAIPGITPGSPTNLVSRVVDGDPSLGNQVKLTWDAGANAQAYVLSQRTFPGGAGVDFDELPYPMTGTSWTFGWLESGRHYKFRTTSARGFLRSAPATGPTTRSRGYPNQPSYAVLGDSYAAGNGMYDKADQYLDGCFRANDSWSSHVLSVYSPSRRIYACSGSEMSKIPGQAEQAMVLFDGRPNSPQLITVSVGGNDVGFTKTLKACLSLACDQFPPPQNLYNFIDAHRPLLTDMYKELRRDFPYADIVAMGYPSPVGTGGAVNLECTAITQAESEFILLATMRLNSRINEAAKDAGVWGGVGERLMNAFLQNGACNKERWIHNAEAPTENGFHANPRGHGTYGGVMNAFLTEKMS